MHYFRTFVRHRLSPRKGALETQAFVGAIRDGKGILVARILVDKKPRGLSADASTLEVIYKLDSAKAKKLAEPVGGGGNSSLPISASASKINVHDLLDIVNRTYPDTLADDVLG